MKILKRAILFLLPGILLSFIFPLNALAQVSCLRESPCYVDVVNKSSYTLVLTSLGWHACATPFNISGLPEIIKPKHTVTWRVWVRPICSTPEIRISARYLYEYLRTNACNLATTLVQNETGDGYVISQVSATCDDPSVQATSATDPDGTSGTITLTGVRHPPKRH